MKKIVFLFLMARVLFAADPQIGSTPVVSRASFDAATNSISSNSVPVTRQVYGTNSIAGGGPLTNNVPLKLQGDTANPGANKVYGTDSGGNRGFRDFPTGVGNGDVVASANNNFTGSNTNTGKSSFIGSLIRVPFYQTTNLNFSTMNLATYSSSSNFAVAFSGSYVTGSDMWYWVTNSAATNIDIIFPETYSLANGKPEIDVEVTANSVAFIYLVYGGSEFFIQAVTKNDATLVALSSSGYFSATTSTGDNIFKTAKTIALQPGYSARVVSSFSANSLTNTGTFEMTKTALFRNDGGTITSVGNYTNSVIRSPDAASWDSNITTDGTNILLQVKGDALNPVNWDVYGFSRPLANASPICSVMKDAQFGSVSEASFPNDSYYWMASKFISTNATPYTMCGIKLKLLKTGTPHGNITVEIWTWDTVGDKPGTLVGTGSSGVPAVNLPTIGDWVKFSDMVVPIIPGNVYAVVMKSSVLDDSGNHVEWYYFFTGQNKAVASNDDGGGWASVNDNGPFEFEAFGNQ